MSKAGVGALAGLAASIPQVLATQLMARVLDLPREHADIGPRFVQRLAERLEQPASPAVHWLLAALFHFAYAAGWGALYGAIQAQIQAPPAAGGATLAGAIYTLAFSRVGAATQTGSERHPERRRRRELVLHWTPAVTFSFITAFGFEWLDRRLSTR
jgi:hypothetical protein